MSGRLETPMPERAVRVLIEQAKGVLAYTEDLTIDAAFGRLLTMSAESGRPLSEVASDIVETLARPHAP